MRLIDADALTGLFREVIVHIAQKPTMTKDMAHIVRAGAMIIEMLAEVPTVDAVKVVRCRECKHWSNEVGICWCDMHSHFKGEDWNMFDADDYCSYGERRNDERA